MAASENDQKMTKYFKFIGDLSFKDWMAIGKKQGLDPADLKRLMTKPRIIKTVYANNQEFFDNWDYENNKVFFLFFEQDGKAFINTSFDVPADEDSYVHRPAATRYFLSPEELKAILKN